MRVVGERNDALPSLSLAGVVENRHTLRRLHDLKVETGVAAKVRQGRGHASLAEAAILRTIGSIDRATASATAAGRANRDVVRWRLGSSWGGRSVLSAFAAR